VSPEDARYYAKELTPVQRRLVERANGRFPTLIKAVAEELCCDLSDAKRQAEQLVSMNLAEIKQSKMGAWFWYNYVNLNERGLKVQAIVLIKKKKRSCFK
jgi:DNA-binding MarR family transcriptional regulator